MKTYNSKFGHEIMGIQLLISALIIGLVIYTNGSYESILTVSAVLLLLFGFFAYLNIATLYTINENGLLTIKCGFLYKKTIDISSIKTITKTNKILSSPAPSLDRIQLTFGKGKSILISPKDKISFASDLIKINPDIISELSN